MRSYALRDLFPASSATSCLLSTRRSTSMKAMPVANTARPNGVQLKKPNETRPRDFRAFSTIILRDDAIIVIIPLISAATDTGMSMRLLFNPVFLAIFRTTGMNMATIAEELIKAPIPPTSNMTSTIRRVSLPPPSPITASPRRYATPVFTNPSPTIKIATIRITTGLPKPANASSGVSTLLNISASTTRIATMSTRIRPHANSAMATINTPNTMRTWSVTGEHLDDPMDQQSSRKVWRSLFLPTLVKIETEDVVHLCGSGHYFDGKQRRECADE